MPNIRIIAQKMRTRVPADNAWTKTTALSARAAIVACSVCRNQVTRGLADLGDQLEGVERIGEPTLEAAMVIIRGPAVRPLAPETIKVPNGLGKLSEVTVGVNTLILSDLAMGSSVFELAQMKPSDFLRKLADQVRQKTSECCRQQVWDRIFPQTAQRKTVHDEHRRTRVVHPQIG